MAVVKNDDRACSVCVQCLDIIGAGYDDEVGMMAFGGIARRSGDGERDERERFCKLKHGRKRVFLLGKDMVRRALSDI